MEFLRLRLLTKHDRQTRSLLMLLHGGMQMPPVRGNRGPEGMPSGKGLSGVLHVDELDLHEGVREMAPS